MSKYDFSQDELSLFMKYAGNAITELNSAIALGVKRLGWGMNQWKNVDKKPSYPPSSSAMQSKPPYDYDEKNFYVNASNNLWYKTFWQTNSLFNYSFSEIYYRYLLKGIKQFEDNENFLFNKGVVYANLGVSQSAHNKLDEGFANLAKALIEDKIYFTDPNVDERLFTRRMHLFPQFEDRLVKIPLQKLLLNLRLPPQASREQTENFVSTFLESLREDQRVFFDYVFARINDSLRIWKDKPNPFTANRLLAYTQDLCLFNEDYLKGKMGNTSIPSSGYWTLKDMIPNKFNTIVRADLRGCGANSMNQLERILPNILIEHNLKKRCLKILTTLRNFTSHNICSGTDMYKTFYVEYQKIFNELIRALYYIKCLN